MLLCTVYICFTEGTACDWATDCHFDCLCRVEVYEVEDVAFWNALDFAEVLLVDSLSFFDFVECFEVLEDYVECQFVRT